jgi:hypothetical protein
MYELALLASLLAFLAAGLTVLRAPQASLAHPAMLYLLFHGFVFVFRPLLAHFYGFEFVYRLYDFEPSLADKTHALMAATLAMIVFVGASLRLTAGAPAPLSESFEALRTKLAMPVAVTAAVLTVPAGWSLLRNWGMRASGFDTMLRDGATGTFINTTGTGYLNELGLMLAPIAVLVLWASRYRWWGWAFFALFALLQAGTGFRGPLIYAAMAAALLWLFEKRRRWADWRLLAGLAATALAFNLIVADRGGAIREALSGEAGPSRAAAELAPLEHMDFANLEYLEYVVHAVPERTGTYDYFASNLQILTEPVPRILWKDKPIGSPVQFFSLWDYGSPIGMTLSIPGNGWMALGYPGVAVQAFLFALIYGGVYRALILRRGGARALLLYAFFTATVTIVFRDGALISLLRIGLFYGTPLLLLMLVERLWHGARTGGLSLPRPSSAIVPPAASPAERRRALALQAAEPPQ